jgi:hypothetical protein
VHRKKAFSSDPASAYHASFCPSFPRPTARSRGCACSCAARFCVAGFASSASAKTFGRLSLGKQRAMTGFRERRDLCLQLGRMMIYNHVDPLDIVVIRTLHTILHKTDHTSSNRSSINYRIKAPYKPYKHTADHLLTSHTTQLATHQTPSLSPHLTYRDLKRRRLSLDPFIQEGSSHRPSPLKPLLPHLRSTHRPHRRRCRSTKRNLFGSYHPSTRNSEQAIANLVPFPPVTIKQSNEIFLTDIRSFDGDRR